MKLIQLVFIVLIVLKVIGLISLSWWIVLFPFWVGAVIFVLGILFGGRR